MTDKLTEKQMATYLGTTHRALQAKRYRNQIPEGVWNLVGRTVYYSKRRYEEWREAMWSYPQELKSVVDQSG